ncbi:MAG: hypothetical protein EA417_15975 [Gammaproteobacteria bacterium]|nr:MAG: hypothetical protein EA417_15975 [Gammaproteobacteria bacterium]
MQEGFRRALGILGLALCGLSAVAMVQAAPGETSAGAVEVSVNLGGRVWLTRINDIDLGTYSGTGDAMGTSRMCVYRNDTGLYNITATSAHADGSVFQAAGDGAFLPYQVIFRDAAGTTFDDLQSGQRLTGLQGQNFALLCLFTNNAQLAVRFAQEDLQAAPPGAYQDVITLLVEPG